VYDNPSKFIPPKGLFAPSFALKLWLYEIIEEREPQTIKEFKAQFSKNIYNWYAAIKNGSGVADSTKKTTQKHIDDLENYLDSLDDDVSKKAYSKLISLNLLKSSK
jgi:hypothetical protein